MLLGVDVSKWQGDMNWDQCASAGAGFAFVRAGSIDNTSGNCYTDYQFIRNISLAPDYIPTGCYWYFRPNHDPIRQADYFSDLIGEEAWLIPPVLDLETTGGKTPSAVNSVARNRSYSSLLMPALPMNRPSNSSFPVRYPVSSSSSRLAANSKVSAPRIPPEGHSRQVRCKV